MIRPCVQVLFDSVGGLSKHIRALKEMIVFPLLYPEIFVRFKIAPPRGVLFHGPPGMTVALADLVACSESLSCLLDSSASYSRHFPWMVRPRWCVNSAVFKYCYLLSCSAWSWSCTISPICFLSGWHKMHINQASVSFTLVCEYISSFFHLVVWVFESFFVVVCSLDDIKPDSTQLVS